VINLRKEVLENIRKTLINTKNVKKNKKDTRVRVDKHNIISYNDLLPGYEEL
jgi:hypothetical protein